MLFIEQECDCPDWQLLQISTFDGLANLFPQTKFETTKLSTDAVNAVKAFGTEDGATAIACTVNGKVALRGLMPVDGLTIEIGLRRDSGNLQWLRPAETGGILLYPPGTEHDSVIVGPMSFISCTIPEDFLQKVAERIGVAVPNGTILEPRLYPTVLERFRF